MGKIGLVRTMAQFSSPDGDICNAASSMVQSLFNGIANLEQFKEDKAKHEAHKEKTGTPHGSKFKPLKLGNLFSTFASLNNATIKRQRKNVIVLLPDWYIKWFGSRQKQILKYAKIDTINRKLSGSYPEATYAVSHPQISLFEYCMSQEYDAMNK